MEDTKESNSSRKSPEGCSREPRLQLQSLQAQDKQVSLSKVHRLKELSWPPRLPTGGGQSTSLKQFPSHPLPPSHSQAPVIITAGRPIVILPNDYIHSHRDFPPGASLSLGYFRDPTPAPIITPVDDDYATTTTSAPIIIPVDDSSPSVKNTVPARQFGGVKAIEFTDDKRIAPGQSEADPHNKEESTFSTGKHTSQLISCGNASNSQELNTIPNNPTATEFDVTSLCKVDPMPNNDESANSTAEMSSQNPSSNGPLSLGVESGNEVQNLEQLHLPVKKSSSMRVSPLIMSCYEENKEQLILDDSDSELEMPECSKSASCTPQQSTEKSTSESGIEDHIHDSNINTPPPKEETLEADAPPPKRAKLMEMSTANSLDALADSEDHSDEKQDDDPQNPIVAEPRDNFEQAVPPKVPPFADNEPLEAAEPTETSSTLADTVPDHSLKLECPHEPLDAHVSDGKDTIDQMLPMESAREHAVVPNLVRCANDNQLDDNRDEPDDDGSGSTHLKAYVDARDLHPSCLGSLERALTGADDNLVPGQTIVEQKTETGIQVPELHEAMPSPCYPLKSAESADIVISAKPGADVCTPSLVVPPTMEPVPLPTEHQIVPEEFAGNTTPSSSQSLYTEHDFHEKCKLSLQFQEESRIDDELNGPRVLAMSLDSIEKRLNIAPSLSHSDDQALPDIDSPSQLTQPHYTDDSSPVGGSGTCRLDKQIGGPMTSGQNLGPFGFRLGKHAPCHQSSENSTSTTRLNLGRPHLRLGLSKRQQCTPLHRPK